MSKFEVSFSESAIVFVDKAGKAQSEATFERLAPVDAMKVLSAAFKAEESGSRAAMSSLTDILKSPRLDGYKGKTPYNETVPTELKAAIRELETEYFKPVFTQYHTDKGTKPATIETQWQKWAGALKGAGSYAVAKTFVTRYFAYTGKLPECDNGQIMTLSAVKKLLENIEKPITEKTGIAGKLVSISNEIENRTEKTDLGDYASAVAALKSMLSTYEGLHREALEKLTEVIGNTVPTPTPAPTMKRAPAPESIDTKAKAITAKAMELVATM